MIAILEVKTWLHSTVCFAQHQDFDMKTSVFHFPLSTFHFGVRHGA
jgi:hypothetical protein